ncbi:hypothetical protein [Mesorhizobium amorphae]|uniref:hypothetical protein n=1 Tax=Mesorhizobium amorphae TaxID=71433 RepID=UPI001184D4A1|nr:hypothetical protein [Mesorhizobium amorphae]
MDISSLIEPADYALHNEVMRNAPMTAVIVGKDHIIVKVLGETLLRHLKYPWPNEIVGQPVEIFLPEQMRDKHRGWFDEWMEAPQDRGLRDASLMTVQRKDGTQAKVRIVLRKLYMEDGGKISKEYAGTPFAGGIAYVVVDE